jgi:hypothetical protein
MTFPLRKKLRTILRPLTPRRTAISLAALACFASFASGQQPSTPIPVPTVPVVPPLSAPPRINPPAAMPTGAPRPQLIPADAMPPAPIRVEPLNLGNPVPQQVPASTMTLTKPAGQEATRPVSATPVSRLRQDPPAKMPETKKDEMPKKGMMSQPSLVDPQALPISRERGLSFDGDEALYRRMVEENYIISKRATPNIPAPTAKDFVVPSKDPIVPPGVTYTPRTLTAPPAQIVLEPGYVVHRKLLFEEKNSERYGWDLGIIQPVVSTAFFYKDTLLWPAHLASSWRERYETSAGKCPPGSPVPYYLYPEEISLFGGTVGTAVFVGSGFIFP